MKTSKLLVTILSFAFGALCSASAAPALPFIGDGSPHYVPVPHLPSFGGFGSFTLDPAFVTFMFAIVAIGACAGRSVSRDTRD